MMSFLTGLLMHTNRLASKVETIIEIPRPCKTATRTCNDAPIDVDEICQLFVTKNNRQMFPSS